MAKQTAKNLPKSQVVKLDNFSVIDKKQLTVLASKYENLVVTKETFNESKKARLELREKRFEIQNIEKGNKALLNSAKKVMDAKAKELIAIISPVEDEIDARIKEIEAEKQRIKTEKEAEQQRIEQGQRDKIGKIQTEFTSAIINLTTVYDADQLKEKLLSFEVTEEEFGNLKLSCEQTILNLRLSITQAKERIEKQIEAENQLKLGEAKKDYKLESGEDWTGKDDIEKIQSAIAQIINKKAKVKVINEYHQLGGEGDVDETMTLDDLIGHLSTLKFELAEVAKQKREEEKVKIRLAKSLRKVRLKLLFDAGIDDAEWAYKILLNDHPEKEIEDLTVFEFNTFKDNIIAIHADITEVDFEEVPVDNPVVKKDVIAPKKEKTTSKKKVTFSKGSWEHSSYAKGNIVAISNGHERLVANCMGYSTNTDNGEHIDESIANANLICAAPDLLMTCINLQNHLESFINATKTGKIRNALTEDNIAAMLVIQKATNPCTHLA